MIDRKIVGVKLPETGWGIGVADEEDVGVGDNVRLGVADGVGVKVADGVASKAGPSAAETTKFLIKVLVTPAASFQVMVIL